MNSCVYTVSVGLSSSELPPRVNHAQGSGCYLTQDTGSCTSPFNSWLEMIYKIKRPPIYSSCCVREHTLHTLHTHTHLYMHAGRQIPCIKYLHCCYDSRAEIALREVEAFWDKSPWKLKRDPPHPRPTSHFPKQNPLYKTHLYIKRDSHTLSLGFFFCMDSQTLWHLIIS